MLKKLLLACFIVLTQFSSISALASDETDDLLFNLSAIVSGIVAQIAYPVNNNFNFEIHTYWRNLKIKGVSSSGSIHSELVALVGRNTIFEAKSSGNKLEGKLRIPLEFDPTVVESTPGHFEIRVPWGVDFAIELNISNGNISGKIRGIFQDVQIKGTYNTVGNVNWKFDGPCGTGINVTGTVKPN